MSNLRLTTAMANAEVTLEEVAKEVDVDPKTVQRWQAGRTPHPRHRYAVAALVNEDEEFLWPGARRRRVDVLGAANEISAAYAHRTDLSPDRWWSLITGAEAQIDLLGYTLYFLPHQHPELIETLVRKCDSGCRVRIAIADPQSEHVLRRDDEEREAITLVARIQSSLVAFAPLLGHANADLRFQDAPLYNSVFRFDDDMLVTPHLYATPGRSAPMLHLRRLGPNGLFSRFAAHFEGIWSDSRAIDPRHRTSPIRSGI